jgi:hypothetical protein
MLLLTLSLMLFGTKRVGAGGLLEIRFVQYFDLTLRLENGNCCLPSCSGSCDNYFEICFVHVGSCITTGNFLTSPLPSKPSVNVKNFTLGQDLGNDLTNPISWSFYGAWPKELNLTFTVWNNSTNPPGKIVSFHYSKSSAFSGNLSSVITTADTYFNKLFHFAWQVTCADNFYGDDCSTHCVPMDGVGGHYNCSLNGTKICLPKWKDPHLNCTNTDDKCLSNPCHYGHCMSLVDDYRCDCTIGFTGVLCDSG